MQASGCLQKWVEEDIYSAVAVAWRAQVSEEKRILFYFLFFFCVCAGKRPDACQLGVLGFFFQALCKTPSVLVQPRGCEEAVPVRGNRCCWLQGAGSLSCRFNGILGAEHQYWGARPWASSQCFFLTLLAWVLA